MSFEKYPYTNFHDLNLDWILQQIKEFREFFDNIDLEEKVQKKVDEYFNKIMIGAIYNEDTETIVLSRELVVNSDIHTYNGETNTLKVGE